MGKVNKTLVKKESGPVKNPLKMKTSPKVTKKIKKPKRALKTTTPPKASPKQKLVKKQVQELPLATDLPAHEKQTLDKKQVASAIKALRELIEKQSKEKKGLFDEEQHIILQINVIKIPKCPARVVHFPLPHSLRSAESEICFIAADVKANGRDHEKTVKHYEDLLEKRGVTVKINKIMPFKQLREEYSQHESKRKLMQLYDFFLVDKRMEGYVLSMVKGHLKQHRKNLLGIKFDVTNLNDHIEKALRKVQMAIHSSGNSFAVNVAHTKMTDEEVIENIQGAFEGLDTVLPGGTGNLRSLHIKTGISMAIPIYVSLKQNSAVMVPVVKASRPKAHKVLKDELSTRNNSEVLVFPSGEVRVKEIGVETTPASTPTKKRAKGGKKKAIAVKEEPEEDISTAKIAESIVVKSENGAKNTQKKGKKANNGVRKAPKRKAVVNAEDIIDEKIKVEAKVTAEKGNRVPLKKAKKAFAKKLNKVNPKQNAKKGKAK